MIWDKKKHKSTAFGEQLLQGVSWGMINDYERVTHSGLLPDHDAVVAMCTVNLFRMGSSESFPMSE